MTTKLTETEKGITESTQAKPFDTKIETHERILARITDGIYRQPSSALRELISNAYDADAKHVSIMTDAPRFSEIVIRDDGFGLSPATLAYVVHSIGGSAKRTEKGKELGLSKNDDPFRSPGGRRLIGKMGIGLFAVSQFTRHFLIVSKQEGDKLKTVADITLGDVTNDLRQTPKDHGNAETFETAKVKFFRQPVGKSELASHGTDIILTELLPRTRAELASASLWERVEFEKDLVKQNEKGIGDGPRTKLPPFHIGYSDPANTDLLIEKPALPWEDSESPNQKFASFVRRLWNYSSADKELVDLEKLCDKYLQTMWTLALSAPLPYIGKHPFDINITNEFHFFKIQNDTKGQAQLAFPKESGRARADQTTRASNASGLRYDNAL